MNFITRFFHELLNPHCDHCHTEKQESRECPNCAILRQLLETEKFEKKELLNHMLEPKEIIREVAVPSVGMSNKVPLSRATPWRVRKELLEQEDRKAAQLAAEHARVSAKSTEELEKELGIGIQQ